MLAAIERAVAIIGNATPGFARPPERSDHFLKPEPAMRGALESRRRCCQHQPGSLSDLFWGSAWLRYVLVRRSGEDPHGCGCRRVAHAAAAAPIARPPSAFELHGGACFKCGAGFSSHLLINKAPTRLFHLEENARGKQPDFV